MKKTLILLLLFSFKSYSQDTFKQKLINTLKDYGITIFMKYAEINHKISNSWIIQAFHKKDLSKESDYILTTVFKDNLYSIELLNICNLKKHKEEYCAEESGQVNATDYELIKKLAGKPLKLRKISNNYAINFDELGTIEFKTEEDITECFLVKNKNLTEILNITYKIDEE